jgi:hypothetical protein
MLPQPMMPMSIPGIVWSDSHVADESVTGTRGLSRIRGLVMLDHHPPGAGRACGPPQVAPVQHAGPDIRPAVLFLVLPGWRDILYMGSAPPRTSQAISTCQPSGLPCAPSKISSSAVFVPSFWASSQWWL